MDQAQRTSVHLVAWNHASLLRACLASLDTQEERAFQVVCVDQASTDGTEAWLRAERPDVVTLRNFRTVSSVRSHNQAIAFALSRWETARIADRFVLFLDPEVILSSQAIGRMVRELAGDPTLAAVGPRLFRAKTQCTEDGDFDEIVYSDEPIFDGYRVTKGRERVAVTHGEAERVSIFMPASGCLMVRASALEAARTGEAWLEEALEPEAAFMDLVWRMRLMGGRVTALTHVRAWRRVETPILRSGTVDRLRAWYREEAFAERRRTIEGALISLRNDPWSVRFFHAPWRWTSRIRQIAETVADPRLFFAWGRVVRLRFAMRRSFRLFRHRIAVPASHIRSWFV